MKIRQYCKTAWIWLFLMMVLPTKTMAVNHPTEYYWGDITVEVGKTKTVYIGDEFDYTTSYPYFISQWKPEDESSLAVDKSESQRSYVIVTGVKKTASPIKLECQISYKLSTSSTTYEVWHGYYMVNVIPAEPDKISILDKLTMRPNEKFKFTYTLTPNNAVTTVTWSSDRTNVITIDESGTAEARALGTATITAKTANGKTATCKVEVVEGNYMEGIVKHVALGGYRSDGYTMLLKTDGTLWACGENEYGQLGDGTTQARTSQVRITDHVISVKTGTHHTMILKDDGTLWACGSNSEGQLGEGTTTNRSTPVKIMDHVVSVSAGNSFTMIIKDDGTLWGCGSNSYGQLGDGTAINRNSPVKIMSDVATVSAGGMHALILKKDGTLWACGGNYNGQLGDGTTTSQGVPVKVNSNVIAVSAGASHTMIVKDDGTLWGCGVNNCGQLGNGTTNNSTTFQKIMDGVEMVSSGWTYSMILKIDGTLWACGNNAWGQFGDGTKTTINRETPIKVMDEVSSVFSSKCAQGISTMMIKKDGSLWACGNNACGQLCDGTTTDRYLPVKIAEGGNTNSTTVKGDLTGDGSVNGTDLVALSNIVLGRKGKTESADVNGDGNVNGTDIVALSNIILGRSSNAPRRASASGIQTGNVKQIVANDGHSLILQKDGTLWACGENTRGQLGDGTAVNKSVPIKIAEDVAYVGKGSQRTMFVKNDGTLWACGDNSDGEFGNSTNTNSLTPIKVMDGVTSAVNGYGHSLILKTDGTLWACGSNYYGQLGDGTTTNRQYPVKIMDNVANMAVGQNHSLIVKKDGTLWTCGDNTNGQLGDGTTTNRKTPVKIMTNVTSVAAGDLHAMILKTDGTLWACGDNMFGQLGDGTGTGRQTLVKVMDDVASASSCVWGYHNMIVKKDGSLWACGNNSDGQFGNGTKNSSNTPVKIMDGVASASAGAEYSLILKSDGTLWACGRNKGGQLGDGTTTSTATPVQISQGGGTEPEPSDCGLSIEPFDIQAGEEKEMLIDLTNPNGEVTLVQFDLHLPEGLSIKKNGADLDFDMAERTTWRKHTLDGNEVDSGYRFLLYSSSNTLIEGTEGAIIKVKVVADESFKGGKIVIDNALLVSPDEQETKPEAYEYVFPTVDDGSARLSIEDFDIKAGEEKEMLIDLTNPNDEITLVQFDLHLPEGLTIKKNGTDLDFDIAGRTTWRKHTLDGNETEDGYRFLLYSSSNSLIEGTEGAIIKVTVVADELFKDGTIVIDNALLVSPDEKETKPERYEYGTGIRAVTIDMNDGAPVYNLRGQRLTAPQKGVNIIGGKKVVVK